jgi:hypothetical protein
MVENVKAVHNPLTIMAIFAALAEVAGTVALGIVAQELQFIFIWFVMFFPILLVLLFFITLNFNPKVLYAPSDFRDEENFLNVLRGVNNVSAGLNEVQGQLEIAKGQIIDEAIKQIGIAGENERARLGEIVNGELKAIQERVESTRESAQEVIQDVPQLLSPIQYTLLKRLSESKEGLSVPELSKQSGIPPSRTKQALQLFQMIGYVNNVDGRYVILPRGNEALL